MGVSLVSEETRTLFVLKGSRVREYLQQNQRLLAAPFGQTTRTRYNETWIAPDVGASALKPGLPALILFSDFPYGEIRPVRHARLSKVSRAEGYQELELRLEEFVAEDDVFGLLRRPASENGVAPKGRPTGGTPGVWRQAFDVDGRKVFVTLGPAGFQAERIPWDEGVGLPPSQLAAWKRTIDFLVGSQEEAQYYGQAVFFRPASLRRLLDDRDDGRRRLEATVGSDLLGPGEAVLEAGATYRLGLYCYNPHLSGRDLGLISLVPEGGGAFSFADPFGRGFPRMVKDGRVDLHFIPRRSGAHALEISVSSFPEISSFVSLDNLLVQGETETPEPQTLSERRPRPEVGAVGGGQLVESADLLRLEEWVVETFDPQPRDHLRLFRDYLGKWSDGTDLVERHAELAFGQGQWSEVSRLLAGREGLSMPAKHRRFLAALEEAQVLDVTAEARALSWTGEHDAFFQHFLALVPRLDAGTRRELAFSLPFDVLGDDKSCALFRVLMDCGCEPELVSLIADVLRSQSQLFSMAPDEVLTWLLGQARCLERPSAPLVDEVLHWAEEANDLEGAVDLLAVSLLVVLADERGLAGVRDALRRLSPKLDFNDCLRLGEVAVDLGLHAQTPNPGADEGVNGAVALLIDLLLSAREEGDLFAAEHLALRMAAILGERQGLDAQIREWADEALREYRAFLEEWEPYRAKLRDELSEKGLELGERLEGKTLHVFTGHQGNHDHLAERFDDLGDITDLPVQVHHLDDRGCADSLRPERDVVVVITRWSGHADTNYIEDRCRKGKVACFTMPRHVMSPERVVLQLWERNKGQ